MSFSLARCVETAAGLLDACGPLEPVQLVLSARDVQLEIGGAGPAAVESLGRLAAVVGADLVTSPPCGAVTHSLTADLADGLVLVAGVCPPLTDVIGGGGVLVTSTRHTAELLRSVLPWVRGLDDQVLGAPELWVVDQGHAHSLRLMLAAAAGDDLQLLGTAAGQGLTGLRLWPTDSGLDGAGQLPCGRTARIGIVSSY
ncbi:hypothetical protein [Streptomyces graminilatus]|uniref:hypothetical protein n=1 Tax=Streptomyces graminilatus TaxID=1464070 RepID=UPI000B2AAD80|nr:hypothetical protein [Streptomyces graminilatus]